MEAKKKKRKVILIGLGIAATAIAGYFGFEYYEKHKRRKEDDAFSSAKYSLPSPPKSAFVPSTYTTTTVRRNDDFPLKKGSRGTKVKALQEALIAKYGSNILPKYGADGDFGSEVQAALAKANLPSAIDESTYNVLVQSSSSLNASELANALYRDAVNANLSGVIASLKQMRSKNDYSYVSNQFKKHSLRGVSQTLVNGLLGSFSDEDSKQQIRLEFLRMGLKYNGTKWSLSGLDGFKVMTTVPTVVWKNHREGAKVPAKMILGTEIAEHRGFTMFENNGRRFIVKTATIKYL
jgi:hypothetical protein